MHNMLLTPNALDQLLWLTVSASVSLPLSLCLCPFAASRCTAAPARRGRARLFPLCRGAVAHEQGAVTVHTCLVLSGAGRY